MQWETVLEDAWHIVVFGCSRGLAYSLNRLIQETNLQSGHNLEVHVQQKSGTV